MTRHRILAHRLSDELPPPRPTIEPIVTSWREAGAILLQAAAIAAFGYVGLVALAAMAGGPR